MSLPAFTLTDKMEQFLTALSTGILGFLASWILEWYKKRKNPTEVESSVMKNANDAANETVVTSQKVIEMLDERLQKDRLYYEELIDRSKKECESKINTMKEIYDAIIADLQAKVFKGEKEKTELSFQVAALTVDKNNLQKEVFKLKMQLNRYENTSNDTKSE